MITVGILRLCPFLEFHEKNLVVGRFAWLPTSSPLVQNLPGCGCRSQYPPELWDRVAALAPNSTQQQAPLAVDVVVGAQGRTGVELAKRWAGCWFEKVSRGSVRTCCCVQAAC